MSKISFSNSLPEELVSSAVVQYLFENTCSVGLPFTKLVV